ncbi:MAG: hypothetical protein GY950_00320 [bacterium]|nr:hypothetical protein [bacterium]
MKKRIFFLGIVFFTVIFINIFINSFAGQENFPLLKGPYLGQKPPGLTPELFASGIVSTERTELNCAFSPDGSELFFTVWKAGQNTLMTMKQENGCWTRPAVAAFSGSYSDVDPYITRDGKRLYFSSMRPLTGTGAAKDSDIWYVEKTGEGKWSKPIHPGMPNTPGKDDYYTSITREGTLYFSIFETHGSPGDIYRSRLKNGHYTAPERIKNSVSTRFNEHDPFVAPDESYLIFTSNRPGGYGRGDLYISFRSPGGTWTEPKNMGKTINSTGYDFCPLLSPDGKYLFFTRNINRNGDIYWVDAKIINN